MSVNGYIMPSNLLSTEIKTCKSLIRIKILYIMCQLDFQPLCPNLFTLMNLSVVRKVTIVSQKSSMRYQVMSEHTTILG